MAGAKGAENVIVVVVAPSSRFLFFFFQAEDGIRDDLVTGVQTCALPIWCRAASRAPRETAHPRRSPARAAPRAGSARATTPPPRRAERPAPCRPCRARGDRKSVV